MSTLTNPAVVRAFFSLAAKLNLYPRLNVNQCAVSRKPRCELEEALQVPWPASAARVQTVDDPNVRRVSSEIRESREKGSSGDTG